MLVFPNGLLVRLRVLFSGPHRGESCIVDMRSRSAFALMLAYDTTSYLTFTFTYTFPSVI